MEQEIFQPSLQENVNYRTQSFDIGKIFYVAFFGGVIPTVVLGTKNAKWLGIDKKWIYLMIGLGAAILTVKAIVTGMIVEGYLDFDRRMLRWIFKGASILLYLGYYGMMKQKFQQHTILGGTTKPILKEAVIWILIGIVIEIVVLTAGGFLVGYIL